MKNSFTLSGLSDNFNVKIGDKLLLRKSSTGSFFVKMSDGKRLCERNNGLMGTEDWPTIYLPDTVMATVTGEGFINSCGLQRAAFAVSLDNLYEILQEPAPNIYSGFGVSELDLCETTLISAMWSTELA